jgi:hypothetical protein
MENEKSSDFDHEIMNLVEKNLGTSAILGRTLSAVYTGLQVSFFGKRSLFHDMFKKIIRPQFIIMIMVMPGLNEFSRDYWNFLLVRMPKCSWRPRYFNDKPITITVLPSGLWHSL